MTCRGVRVGPQRRWRRCWRSAAKAAGSLAGLLSSLGCRWRQWTCRQGSYEHRRQDVTLGPKRAGTEGEIAEWQTVSAQSMVSVTALEQSDKRPLLGAVERRLALAGLGGLGGVQELLSTLIAFESLLDYY
jgi:hypothetical protein